jgi:lysophospholipase L1-like esterase
MKIRRRVDQLREGLERSRFTRYRNLAPSAIALAIFAMPVLPLTAAFAGNGNEQWIGSWSTALHAPEIIPEQPGSPGFNNQTLRQIVHTSIGGDRVRVRLSTFGASPLVVGAAHIARRAAGAAIMPGTDRPLTFSGNPSITIPPGAIVLSDPVDTDIPALSDIAVSIYVPGNTGSATWHLEALQTSYVSPPGDFTGSTNMPFVSTTHYRDPNGAEHDAWFWLAGVEVMASKQTGAIVILGDSVTDGTRSTPDTNNRWPDHLARRLMSQPGNETAVLNQGIAGNKLLNDIIGPNALARFDRDVLTQTGVTHVIVLLGNNDILFVFSPSDFVSAEQIVAGHRQLIQRAHARGLKIHGGTLTPFGGLPLSSAQKEEARKKVNDWIRNGGEYDSVIDFDEIMRDPNSPTQLRPTYDSGDHLHPNDVGYKAMGEAIDLKLFKNNEGKQYQREARKN